MQIEFDIHRAMKAQEYLSKRVLESLDKTPRINPDTVRYIAGFDSSYTSGKQCAVVVVYDLQAKRIVEEKHVFVDVKVPYIPGLLAFREIPGYIRVYQKLGVKPDILLVDGHGLAHPRAFGITTHLGLVLDKPSIGVAKKKLYGEIIERGARRLILAHGRIVGEVVKHEGQDLYVSIGYKITLEDAVTIVKSLLVKGIKLPIPIQIADTYSKTIKNKYYK